MITTNPAETEDMRDWARPVQAWNCLSDYEKSFYKLEFVDRGLAYYESRLGALGFTGLGSVLDAGCGMGQWSIALAGLNARVEGVDINSSRLLTAQEIAKAMGRENVRFQYAPLEALPFPDSSFDAIFCYGVFMFTNMPRTLREFHRVLRPGGRAYLNVNTYGWYAHLLVDRGVKARSIGTMIRAGEMIARGMIGLKGRALVRHQWLLNALRRTGFAVLAEGLEGSTCLSESGPKPRPIYDSHHYGLPSIREYLVVKE